MTISIRLTTLQKLRVVIPLLETNIARFWVLYGDKIICADNFFLKVSFCLVKAHVAELFIDQAEDADCVWNIVFDSVQVFFSPLIMQALCKTSVSFFLCSRLRFVCEETMSRAITSIIALHGSIKLSARFFLLFPDSYLTEFLLFFVSNSCSIVSWFEVTWTSLGLVISRILNPSIIFKLYHGIYDREDFAIIDFFY